MKPAAFQATFTDWRLIKGRKVVQLVFEVPVEGADAAYQALGGMPDPGASVWCAIARLQTEGKVRPQAEAETNATAFTEKPALEAAPQARAGRLTKQAGIACSDPRFWKFLTENDMPVANEHDAAVAVRFICHVASRKELIPRTEAGDEWENLFGRYLAWREAPEFAA